MNIIVMHKLHIFQIIQQKETFSRIRNKFGSKSLQELKKLYFCNDRIRHASRRKTSEPGRVFYFYHDGKHLYKTSLSINFHLLMLPQWDFRKIGRKSLCGNKVFRIFAQFVKNHNHITK